MKIGVIADDLTGANATGVRLAKQGFISATVVSESNIPVSDQINAVCIDTDSRYSAKRFAKLHVLGAIKRLREWEIDVICKRIDSTVRGNIGIEIDTMLSEFGEKSIAIVVPSFPDSGRITSGGYLLVEGVPVQETDVAKDPIAPITQSYVPDLIQEQSEYPVSHIGLQTVLSGKEAIEEAIQYKINQKKRIIILDAVTDEEIESIAEAMASIKDYRMIPVDPGPLTATYARVYAQQNIIESKIIVTVGSVTSLTRKQLQYVIDKTNVSPVYVLPEKLATFGEGWDKEVARSVDEALDRIHQGRVLIITTHSPSSKIIDLKEVAKQEGVTQNSLAKRITDGLGMITRLVMKKSPYPIGGCFSSGGDVTASLCASVGAEGIRVEDEVLPLTSFGRFIGGDFHGSPIITKGGMVGDKRAIHTSVKFLMTKIANRRSKL